MSEAGVVENANTVRAYTLTTVVVMLTLPNEFDVVKGSEVFVYKCCDKLIVSKKKLSGYEFLFKRKVQQNKYGVRFIYLPRWFTHLSRKDLKYVVHSDYVEYEI